MHARKRNSKLFGVLLSLLLVAALCVGGTLAYLKASDSPVTNTFTLADIHTHIEEGEGGNEQSKVVYLTNPSTSTGPVWIRARVLVSSGTAAVNFVAAAPETKAENTIYVVIGSDWTEETDGYYYYNNLVAVNGKTTALVNGVYAGAGVDAGTFDVIVSGEAVLGSAGGNAQAAFAKIN
ncbi:MAG: hypothetical protein SPE74_06355 [Oscillospiraceae bacterium]|nr:hypothetical protein [Oscillospiraceae bacterium]